MTREFECFMESDGKYLAGKLTAIILKGKVDVPLECLLVILNSKIINYFNLIFFNSLKINGRAINFGPQQLFRIPFPNQIIKRKNICDIVKNINEINQNNPKDDIESKKIISINLNTNLSI